MFTTMAIVFVLGYLAIALEHNIHVDKAASALITGIVTWTLLVLGMQEIIAVDAIPHYVADYIQGHDGNLDQKTFISHYVTEYQVLHHLSEIASILFFLLGAMTIVEMVDSHNGFSIITDRISTTKKSTLLWIVTFMTFFLSALLDNLTTSIVMVSLLRKLIADKQDRWLFAGMVVIAANAGGAWSPIGDVTTTMLWIGEQVTTAAIITKLLVPSIVALLVPVLILTFTMKGEIRRPDSAQGLHEHPPIPRKEQVIVLILGIGGLVFVPIFKTITHLPPFMGMMLSLGVLWFVTDLMHRHKAQNVRKNLGVIGVIRKIDSASILFFLGILLAVAALQTAGHLAIVAGGLDQAFGTDKPSGIYAISVIIGLLSAIVDNVPLVAGAMGMYPLQASGFFATDGLFWEFLAYCAGTGGSVLIIGSAAGVAVMGLEKIDFVWYLKRISLLALLGYLAGAAVYILEASYLHT
jgi:Na+/H+ antiporter NhaD/arsenite permease-like protein